jgi:hypothetical protein
MVRIKQLAFAGLMALALAAGGVAVSDAPQAQLAWSWGSTMTGSVVEPEPGQSAAYKKGSFDITELGGESVASGGGRGDCTACH